MSNLASRDRLIRSASSLFRRKGYAAVGVAEILKASGLPKGSLYHHFPGGKEELAEAATRWAAAGVERLIHAAFASADSFEAGALALCRIITEDLAERENVPACPVLSILQAGDTEPALRETAADLYGAWSASIARHARRLGVAYPEQAAFSLHARLQGAWVIAYAQQSNEPFLMLAEELAAGR